MDNLQALYSRQAAVQLEKNAEDMLAVSSWSWHADYYTGSWSLLNLPEAAVSAGITVIECNDFMLPPPRLSRIRRPLLALLPGVPPELWRYSRTTLRQLAANAQANRTSILTWAINSDFTVSDRHWPAQRLYLRRGLAAARFLQTPLLRINLGGSPETSARADEVVVRRLVDFVERCHQRCPGVTFTVENHWGISTDIERHLAIVDAVASRLSPPLQNFFGCCFDPANMADSPKREHWWQELARRANHFHLKTNAFDAEGQENNLPHKQLFGMLREAGYSGMVTIEYAGAGPAVKGVRQSAQLFKQVTS